MSKAQMEIFGLVVIVILLAMGLLFAILILTKGPTGETARIKESVQAGNFLNTIMGTHSIGCGKRTVRGLIQDCAQANEAWTTATLCDDGATNTCQLAQTMIATMLQETLTKWGKNYVFFIDGTPAVEKLKIESGTCEGEREGSSRPEKIKPGLDVTVSLHICR